MSEFIWEEEAKRYAPSADFWRSKLEALEADNAQLRAELAALRAKACAVEDVIRYIRGRRISRSSELYQTVLQALEPKPAIPPWRDPYTNNGDSRSDTDFRHGWNACRDAMLAAQQES
jgi:hypothetical protein